MATGFMARNCIALLLVLGSATAGATDIALIGVIGRKAAVLALDGGDPKTVKTGQTWKGITVVEVQHDSATIETEGARHVLRLGAHHRSGPPTDTRASVVLASDGRGHFFAEGAIDGGPVRFLVDTGASMVVLPAEDARRLGIDYLRGARTRVQTAAGNIPAYLATFDRVKVGGIELREVDGLVVESAPIALLGMSFLNRVEMRRNGDQMTLIRRF